MRVSLAAARAYILLSRRRGAIINCRQRVKRVRVRVISPRRCYIDGKTAGVNIQSRDFWRTDGGSIGVRSAFNAFETGIVHFFASLRVMGVLCVVLYALWQRDIRLVMVVGIFYLARIVESCILFLDA